MDVKLITLKAFDNSIEAHLLRTRLENEGIHCFIFDENIVTLNPLYNILVGGIKLKVSSKDLPHAKKVLSDLESTPFVNEAGVQIHCPNCNSQNLYSRFKSMKSTKGVLTAFVSFILAVYPFYVKTYYRCKNCQTEFKAQ